MNKKDKTFQFSKNSKKAYVAAADMTINEKLANEMYDVWLSTDLVEVLIDISETNQV